jgi:hypothetical protein
LGTSDQRSFDFYIINKKVLLEILNQNVPWVIRTFKKMGAQFGFNHIITESNSSSNDITIEYDLINKGFGDFD